ncbi:hypothetical protein E2562_036005 [Oryza meyeriana var. granulata]|uniref:At1g61320/AtMIF1 LRR domain-containing protein n=1 Tax=Oryza meyeriana var. granulata TaxID=110450 RepID=A0A6G1CX35_9ORYZ|nr:hypothetical protein E2562_036005 [Oryza meyeriana var. granulata]
MAGLLTILDEESRLERLSVVVHTIMKSSHLRSLLVRASVCGVEELHVDLLNPTVAEKARFRFPILSGVLEHLSLRHIVLSKMRFGKNQRFDELAVIYFYSVTIETNTFMNVITRCPNLRVLDLRCCFLLDDIAFPPGVATNLRSLTIAGCNRLKRVDVVSVPSLRSVFYSGRFLSSFYLPRTRDGDASFTDLYICYDGSIVPQVFGKWSKEALPKLSNLSNLTICSNALQIVSSLPNEERTPQLAWLGSFQSLTELQLLMFEMRAKNLAGIYAFLENCHCPNLTRLFLQLPRIRDRDRQARLESVSEEVPEDGLGKLRVVRIMNFNRTRIEIQLVSFLLRKARDINTLQLVSPSPNTIPLGALGVEQEDIRPIIQEALANGVIKYSKSDDGTTQPCHSEVFIKF